MTLSDPQVASLVSSSVIGAAMVWLAVKHHLLEVRVRSRRCPACGRLASPRSRCACRD